MWIVSWFIRSWQPNITCTCVLNLRTRGASVLLSSTSVCSWGCLSIDLANQLTWRITEIQSRMICVYIYIYFGLLMRNTSAQWCPDPYLNMSQSTGVLLNCFASSSVWECCHMWPLEINVAMHISLACCWQFCGVCTWDAVPSAWRFHASGLAGCPRHPSPCGSTMLSRTLGRPSPCWSICVYLLWNWCLCKLDARR